MTTHTETLTSLLKLPSEVLRLRLAGANLAMNGSKRDQARRLWDHIRQNPPTDQRRSRRQTRERGHGTTTTTSQPSQQHTRANIAEEESNSSGDDGNDTDDGSNPRGSSSGSEGSDSSLEDDDRAVLRRVGQTSRNRRGSPASGAVRRQEADKNPARSSQLPPSSRRHRSRSPAQHLRSRRDREYRSRSPSWTSRQHSRAHRRPEPHSRSRGRAHRDVTRFSPRPRFHGRSRPSWNAPHSHSDGRDHSRSLSHRRGRRHLTPTSSDTDTSENTSGRQRWRSSSSSNTSSSSSSSRSASPATTDESSRGRHSTLRRRCHHHRRRHHHHHHHGHRFTWAQGSSPFVCCAPPPSDRVISRIRKGKYVNFDLLLPNTDETLPVQGVRATGARKGSQPDKLLKRKVTDFQSWMEAWNTFLLITVHTSQDRCLELLKYQTLIGHLFSAYPIPVCLRYDQLFRRAAARDSSLPWDSFKEDLLIWCTTFRPLRSSLAARLGPPSSASAGSGGGNSLQRATHTSAGVEICKRFNSGSCTRGEECKFAHSCWHASCRGSHSAKACPLRTTAV